MPTSLKQIEELALARSADERAMLAKALLASLDPVPPDVKNAWAEKVKQRIAAIERGEIFEHGLDDELFAEVRRTSR